MLKVLPFNDSVKKKPAMKTTLDDLLTDSVQNWPEDDGGEKHILILQQTACPTFISLFTPGLS